MASPLRVLPNSTAEAMHLLGETKIADVLGTYEYLLGERDGLFHRLLQAGMEECEAPSDAYRALFKAWRRSEHRLWIYRLLLNESGPL